MAVCATPPPSPLADFARRSRSSLSSSIALGDRFPRTTARVVFIQSLAWRRFESTSGCAGSRLMTFAPRALCLGEGKSPVLSSASSRASLKSAADGDVLSYSLRATTKRSRPLPRQRLTDHRASGGKLGVLVVDPVGKLVRVYVKRLREHPVRWRRAYNCMSSASAECKSGELRFCITSASTRSVVVAAAGMSSDMRALRPMPAATSRERARWILYMRCHDQSRVQ